MAENNPLVTFAPFKCNRKRKGKMGKWQYCFHGFHCTFENKKTEQNIEVPLAYGFDFGDLDPYFFRIYQIDPRLAASASGYLR